MIDPKTIDINNYTAIFFLERLGIFDPGESFINSAEDLVRFIINLAGENRALSQQWRRKDNIICEILMIYDLLEKQGHRKCA